MATLKTSKKLFVLMFMCVSLISCSHDHTLISTWKTADITLWERITSYLHGATNYTSGTELILNTDSSFKLMTCGNISLGKWKVKNDSLLLNSDTCWYRKSDFIDPDKRGLLKMRFLNTFIIEKSRLIGYETGSVTRDGSGGSTLVKQIKSVVILKVCRN